MNERISISWKNGGERHSMDFYDNVGEPFETEDEIIWYVLEMINNDENLRLELSGCVVYISDLVTKGGKTIRRIETSIEIN